MNKIGKISNKNEIILNEYNKIGSGLYRNVYDIGNGKVVKKSRGSEIRIGWNPNNNESIVFKDFKKSGFDKILANIFEYDKKNNLLVMERLNIINSENIELIEKLKNHSSWNRDILDYIEWIGLEENIGYDKDGLFEYYFENELFSESSEGFEFIYKKLKKLNETGKGINFLNDVIQDLYLNNIGYDNDFNVKILDYGG